MAAIHEAAHRVANAIEAELRRIGRWSAQRPPDSAFKDMGPFGMNTLSAEQWLQFVLVPRLHEIVNARGEFPQSSNVSGWATRNFDGDPDADELLRLLRELDAMVEDRPPEEADIKAAPPAATASRVAPKLASFLERLVAHLRQLPAVKEAYIAQLFFPTTEQLTSPVLGLVLDGALAPDAFAPLGTDDPLVVMLLGEDAVSRLVRLGPPLYARETAASAGSEPGFYIHPDYK